MKKNEPIRGCGTALVTPFLDNGQVDEMALKRLVQFQIREGIDFLVPCGSTGESATLHSDEILRVIEIVLETANGKVPVVAGAGGYDTAKVVELAKAVAKLGVDAILSVTPYYNRPTPEGLYQHFQKIAEAVDVPVILYNIPGRTGCNLLPDTVIRLSKIPNIIGIKEASGNIDQIVELSMKVPEDFLIFSGDDAVTIPIIALGGAGVISVIANEMPKQMAKLVQACLKGEFLKALELQKKMYPLMRANFIETNPIPVKAALAMMRMIRENYRLPLVSMKSENRAKLHQILLELKLIK